MAKPLLKEMQLLFLALKGQVKNMLKSNLPFQGARCYYRYVLTGGLPPD
jgi:hypothetical protein